MVKPVLLPKSLRFFFFFLIIAGKLRLKQRKIGPSSCGITALEGKWSLIHPNPNKQMKN